MAETMKDSGQEWIGTIPESWDTNRIRYCLDEINVKNSPVKTEQILSLVKDKGVMLYEEKGDVGNKAKEDITGYKVAFPNTLIVNSMNILIGSVGISQYKGCVSPVYYVFREKDNSDLRFINYIFNTREFQKELRKYANGILEIRLRVSATDIFNRKIPLPPKEEQIKIADFLDEKCAEIDQLSEDIQKQIDILEEYKKSVITRAVTKGLNSDVEMKDSGIDWIGQIPKGWEMLRIKNLGTARNGLTYSPNDLATEEDGTLVLRSSNVKDGKINLEDNVYVSCKIPSNLMVKKGDILICSRNGSRELIGKNAIIDDIHATYGAFMMVYRSIDPEYLYYVLNSEVFSYYLGTFFTSTINQLTGQNFNNMKIVFCPDKNERAKIVEYLKEKTLDIDDSIQIKRQQLDNLNTYKKSIIYEYVTGKKRVA